MRQTQQDTSRTFLKAALALLERYSASGVRGLGTAEAQGRLLRLHDLRHEAVSRFFEYGLTFPEVALISGHRDPRMLSRHTHLRPEKVAEKLAKATA